MIKNIDAKGFCDKLYCAFSKSCDFAVRQIFSACGKTVYIASFSGFCDKKYISESILRPLLAAKEAENIKDALAVSKLNEASDVEMACQLLLDGNALIIYDTKDGLCVLGAEAKGAKGRGVQEPSCEVVIRGPREGFTESAEANLALLRKRLKTHRLCVEKTSCGKLSQTDVFVVYIDGCANVEDIELIKQRLCEIKLPSVMDSGYIEHSLGDAKYPLFPDVGNSEKPDKVAAKLVAGRVAVICDGSPCVLTLPYFLLESLQSSEDYLKSPYYATFIRLLRVVGVFLALFLPGLYVALLEYNVSAIPHRLFKTIALSRSDIPFTVFTELCVILLVFELIREVGVRMPRAVGDAVSIVAGIILGDAAIKAGIAGAPVIMVAAISATCSFIAPPIMNAMPLIRLGILVLSRLFGLFGLAFCMIALVSGLCVKTSCGKPYLYPFSPINARGLKDTVVVVPDKALAYSDKEMTRHE